MTPGATTAPVLRDIHVPDASWWPPAPGWWIVLGLLLLALAWLAWYLPRWRRARSLRRAVDAELRQLESRYQADGDAAHLAAGLSQLLRRVARRCGRQVHLGGSRWRQELQRLAPDALDEGAMIALQQALYQPRAKVDGPRLVAACRTWLYRALERGHA